MENPPRVLTSLRRAKVTISQIGSICGVLATAVAWAFSLSNSIEDTHRRIASLENESKRVRVMVLQNRVLTLEITRELANKIDAVTGQTSPGLTGVDLAIQQANAELEREKN